jgi:hypothetical protein
VNPGVGTSKPDTARLIAESEALHRRVRAFRHGPATAAAFDELALEIAQFQARHQPGFRRLIAARGSALDSVEAIPAVPSDAFRLTRVAVFPPELDSARFFTSGTTDTQRGMHAMRSTETYRDVALAFGREALGVRGFCTVLALAPIPDDPPSSSLAFMMAEFMREFDVARSSTASLDVRTKERWLLRSDGIDIDALERESERAAAQNEPLLLLATSYALASLVESLHGSRVCLPETSRVMQTGGYKGRHREISEQELKTAAASALGVAEAQIVSEYGMTELSSQLYEGSLPAGGLSGPPGVYLSPAWLRVTPVDPETLEPVPEGSTGLARFVDLANVDSAVAVVTRDLIRRRGAGIELLGREPGAEPRGCSLAVEALLGGALEGMPGGEAS